MNYEVFYACVGVLRMGGSGPPPCSDNVQVPVLTLLTMVDRQSRKWSRLALGSSGWAVLAPSLHRSVSALNSGSDLQNNLSLLMRQSYENEQQHCTNLELKFVCCIIRCWYFKFLSTVQCTSVRVTVSLKSRVVRTCQGGP
jgi:hypothetical protein